MPHDIEGKLIRPGDIVTVNFLVMAITPGEEYCNLSLETVLPVHPGDAKVPLTLNSKQVRRTEVYVVYAEDPEPIPQ